MPSLKDLRFLQDILGKLNAEKPAGVGMVGQTKRQERSPELLKRLQLEAFSQEGIARVLFTGQIGVGKSSELWHFFRQRVEEKQRTGFWVYCDLEKEEHPERCGATGVFLTVLRDCWGATKGLKDSLRWRQNSVRNEFNQIRDELLKRLIDWLKGQMSEDGRTVIFRFGGMDFPVWLTNKDSAVAIILGKAAQHEAVSDRLERFGIIPDRLVSLMNKLFRWLKKIHWGLPPLLIIDHVDKIRDKVSAKEVLVEVIPQWRRIEASVIMTAPYEYTLGEMRNSVESYWGSPLMVYPMEFPQIYGDKVHDFYIKIIESCELGENIAIDSLKLLAHYSGGIPRAFVQFVCQACKEAHLAGHDQIELSDAKSVIFVAARAYQDYGIEELELLKKISETKIGLGSAATLLRSPIGLLVLPPEKGEHPLRIHPLAETTLDRYYSKLEG